jgi:hypothetical protein
MAQMEQMRGCKPDKLRNTMAAARQHMPTDCSLAYLCQVMVFFELLACYKALLTLLRGAGPAHQPIHDLLLGPASFASNVLIGLERGHCIHAFIYFVPFHPHACIGHIV